MRLEHLLRFDYWFDLAAGAQPAGPAMWLAVAAGALGSGLAGVALARAALPLLRPGGALLTLTYIGAQRAVPHYNVMGVAKAALEASVRYLAADFGADARRIRVNAISAGPIRTLAVAGIAGSRALINAFGKVSLLRRNITIEDVGNAAAYLCSDLAAGVTGEVHYVDAGFNVAFPLGDEGGV
jgi:enoyl-[acyl-carrier protein] reductase I